MNNLWLTRHIWDCTRTLSGWSTRSMRKKDCVRHYIPCCVYVLAGVVFVHEIYQWFVERLHNARLERERIIGEQQLEQPTTPHKTRQSKKLRSQSVTLPTAINKEKRVSIASNSGTQRKTTTKTVNRTKERSASIPASNPSSTNARLPSVTMGLPEKVAPL